MDGILVVNKEKDKTSRDVVNEICKIFNTKKVGHTGTLDPMATGVLVICINKALKIVNEITCEDKEYIAEITLGKYSDTLDITGNILKEEKVNNITNEEIDKVLNSFIGEYDMEVPKYSAIKINGKKLYEYARNNIDIKLPIHKVYIYELKRINDIKDNKFMIKCKVSKGTYIRSLVRDIAYRLNTIGCMSKLIRTKQGMFDINNSYTIDEIKNGKYKLISIIDALNLPVVNLEEDLYKKVINGNKIKRNYDYDKFLYVYKNKLIAEYKYDKNDNLYREEHMFI